MSSIEPSIWIIRPGPNRLPSGRDPLDGDDGQITIDNGRSKAKWFHPTGSILRWGAWVNPEHVMTRFAWRGTGTPPDFHNCEAFTFVSGGLRELIEHFEPRVHQFLPVEIMGKNRSVLANQFLLIPGQGIRCFAANISYGYEAIGPEDRPEDWIWHPQRSCRQPRPLFEDDAVRDKHLWIPTDFSGQLMVVSNPLRRALLDSGLESLAFSPLETRANHRHALPKIKPSPFFEQSARLSGSALLV